MKSTKKAPILYFILLLLFFPGPGGTGLAKDSLQGNTSKVLVPANTVLTLARAKSIALENSPSLASVRERVTQAKETIVQARAGYLPTLSLNGSWEYTEKTAATEADKTLYSHGISASQILFDGFERKYALISAKSAERQSIEAEKQAQSLLVWSVASAYLSVQQALEEIKIAQSDMEYNQNLAKVALAKQKAGTGSLSDLLNFETQANSAQSALIDTRQAYKEAAYVLAALMGYADSRLPKGTEPTLPDVNGLLPDQVSLNQVSWNQALQESDEEMKTILEKRFDLKQSRYAIQAAQARIQEEKSGFFPTISLTGSYGVSSAEKSDHLSDTDYMGACLGVNVSFELFSGGATRSRVREAISKKQALEKDLEDAKIMAQAEIRGAADKIVSAREKFLLQEKNAGLLQKTRDLVEKEYRVGQASLVRLNEVQNNLVATLGDLAAARVSLILALEAFDYYTGQNIKALITP